MQFTSIHYCVINFIGLPAPPVVVLCWSGDCANFHAINPI